MDRALEELIRISTETGVDPTLVQGGGGNTSVKTADGKYMYIKASGTALKDMNAKEGWRRLRLDLARSVVKDESLAKMPPQTREPEVVNRLLLACDDNVKTEARPSVEAHLHAWLDTCVIHLHPSAAGAYHNARNGRAKLQKLFKAENPPLLWVPYTDPGFLLAKRIARLVQRYKERFGKDPAILFLEKHGLFVTASSASGALRLVRRVIKRCNSKLKRRARGPLRACARRRPERSRGTFQARGRVKAKDVADVKNCIGRAYFEATGERTMIWYYNNNGIEEFCRHKDARKMLLGPLTPDELVYANGPAMWVELQSVRRSAFSVARRLRQQIERGRKPSAAFLVRGVGLFVAATEKIAPTVRDIVLYSIFIRTNAHRMGGIVTLNKRQQDFINNWESEAFRKKLASEKK
jgi:rhamnose utilization protein RhaD (predicted bifunctional aldolase and dehydrogenase)